MSCVTTDTSDSRNQDCRLSNYPDAAAVSIDEPRPQRAVAAMVNGSKGTRTDTSLSTAHVTKHMVQFNEVVPLHNCIMCNARAVLWPEPEFLKCQSNRVLSPGDLGDWQIPVFCK